jgi:hypothetical protein
MASGMPCPALGRLVATENSSARKEDVISGHDRIPTPGGMSGVFIVI